MIDAEPGERVDDSVEASGARRWSRPGAPRERVLSEAGEGSPQLHIFLLERPPAGGADRILALLEGGEIAFDAARVAAFLQCRQHLLRGTDSGSMGLRRVDAQAE